MKRTSIKENETRVNTFLNQLTYNLKKKQNKQAKQQQQQNLLDLPNLERKEKETYRRSFRNLTI